MRRFDKKHVFLYISGYVDGNGIADQLVVKYAVGLK